jgi:hypothetical protein
VDKFSLIAYSEYSNTFVSFTKNSMENLKSLQIEIITFLLIAQHTRQEIHPTRTSVKNTTPKISRGTLSVPA